MLFHIFTRDSTKQAEVFWGMWTMVSSLKKKQSKDLGVPPSYKEQVSYGCSHFFPVTVKIGDNLFYVYLYLQVVLK